MTMPRGILNLLDNSPKSPNRGGGYTALKLGRTGILSTMPRGILILLDNSPKLINCGGVFCFKNLYGREWFFLASKFKKMTQKCGILKGFRGPKIGNFYTTFFAGSEIRFLKKSQKCAIC